MSALRVMCPHCGSKATIRTSRQLSDLVRSSYCQCSNSSCGHTFVTHTEVVRTISLPPEEARRPGICLPVGKQPTPQPQP